MKKFLLTAFAALTCAWSASAQIYTGPATPYEDEDWAPNYDEFIQPTGDVTVEAYANYVIIRSWLGDEGYDLRVDFDADENVTAVTPITDGEEGSTFTSDYAGFSTGNQAYYYTQLYLGEGYDYAYADEEGGYVMLSGYFYKSSTEYVWGYYNIYWDLSDGSLYSVVTETIEDEDWAPSYDACIMVSEPIKVSVYEDYLMIYGWLGDEGYDLRVNFDADENVTGITAITNGEEGETFTDGYCGITTGNDKYYYAQLYLGEGYDYAFADEEGGYVILSGCFYTSETEYAWAYYCLDWTLATGGDEEEPLYTVITKAVDDPEYTALADGAFCPENDVTVKVYDDYIVAEGWAGDEGYAMEVGFDQEGNVTYVIPIIDGVKGTTTTEGYASFYTGNDEYYYVSFYIAEGYSYAYANAAEGYILLVGTFYKTSEDSAYLCYYLPWEVSGIESVASDNAPVEYYNIQGMRIENPTKGLYIVRQGNKSTKTIIR